MTQKDKRPSFRLVTFPAATAAAHLPATSSAKTAAGASSSSHRASASASDSSSSSSSSSSSYISSTGILDRFQRLNDKRLLTWQSAASRSDRHSESEPGSARSCEPSSDSTWEPTRRVEDEMKQPSPKRTQTGLGSVSRQLALLYNNLLLPSRFRSRSGGLRNDDNGYCQLRVWQCQRRLKLTFTCFILATHVFFQLWVWSLAIRGQTLWDWPGWQFACASVVSNSLPLTFWLIFDWMRSDSSAAARQASWLFLYYWACQMALTYAKVVDKPTAWELAGLMIPGKYMMTVLAIWWRVSMAEQAFEVRGYARVIAILGLSEFSVIFVKAALFLQRDHSTYLSIQHSWDNFYKTFALIVIAAVCWRLFSSILATLNRHPDLLEGKQYILLEARWADAALRRVRTALVGLSLVGSLANGIQFSILVLADETVGSPSRSVSLLFDIPTNMYLLVDFSALLLTVGCFQKQKPGEKTPQRDMSEEDVTRNNTNLKDPEWQQTVLNLALRYITAGELLEFYRDLSALMPHFDPDLHTTNDIVRAAVIPASLRRISYDDYSPCDHNFNTVKSANGEDNDKLGPWSGRAYVDWLDEDRVQAIDDGRLFAQRMVTHDWRNLFVHLVAAVLADALGKDEYGIVARDLRSEEGIEQLKLELQLDGCQEIRYWICAFCVNQHKGICGAFPLEPDVNSPEYSRYQANRVDTATGEEHQCCTCEEPKYWYGDLCEMNKFDDLMHLLNVEVPELRQVVAIDRNFELFSRVWCVAELVEAHRSHLQQNVCLLWRQALDANTGDLGVYLKLATLSVNGCSAARETDKDRILDKIRATWGIPEFDAQLQATIFGPRGLLGKELVGFDVIHSAARAALRVKVVESHPAS